MNALRSKHTGQTAWIICKGPSLGYLSAGDIGSGPVIALNHSILAVERLNLPNPIYSVQKDGECVRPEKATLILHDLESGGAFSDYKNRHVFTLADLCLSENVFSLIFAGRFAQLMGCADLQMVCCDLHVNGDRRTYVPGQGIAGEHVYLNQLGHLPVYLADIDYQFVTPQGETVCCQET